MKAIKNILLVLAVLSGYACSNFDDLNSNPNAATEVTSSLLATPLILDLTQTGGTAVGFIADNCLAKQMVWMEYLYNYNYNQLGRSSVGDYKQLINAQKMVDFAAEDYKQSYQALNLFLRAYKLFYHSMRLGDVPYSEALRGEEGILKPKYDTQEEVMKQVLNELEEASRLFNGAKNFSGDPVLGGNTAKWKKVTDAFRLKVLLYLSKKENHAELKVKERFRSIVQSGSLMESSDDNLQLVFSNKSGQIYPYNRQNSNHYYYCTVSSVIIDMLKAYNDYRLFYFAQPAKTQLDKGLASNDPEAYIGLDPVGDYSISQSLYSEGTYAAMGKRYTEVITGEPYIRVGYAEQNFILAEAVLRGWIDGDAEAYYNKGIEASMKFTDENTPDDAMYHQGMKITDKYIQEYLASDVIKLTGDFNQKLKQIISQKYLTYYMQHPYDAYFEYRRTGYPELPINPATNRNTEKDKMPVRWMYPTWEFDYNKENLEEAVNRQYGGVDDNNKIMWILQ